MTDAVSQRRIRDQEILSHMPLVRRIAGSLYNLRKFDGIPFDDYVQMGAEGLLKALDGYDPDQGASFETYAGYRIRGSILSGLEKATEVNQQVISLRRLARDRLESLTERGDDTDTASEDPSKAAFARLLEASVGLAVAFMLDDTALYVDEAATPHWDDGAANLSFKQLQRRLLAALDVLNAQERKVIEMHYFEHVDFEHVALSFALSRSRISQIHRQALGRLKAALHVGCGCDLLG